LAQPMATNPSNAAAAKLVAKRQKAEKAALRRIRKCMQPRECLKHVAVLLDDRIANDQRLGPSITGCLNGQQVVPLDADEQRLLPLPAIRWRRNVHALDPAAFADLAHDALPSSLAAASVEFEELESDSLLIMDGRQLVELIQQKRQSELSSLVFPEQLVSTNRWSPSLVVYDLELHITQSSRAAEGNALRAKMLANSDKPAAPPAKKPKASTADQVTRLQCEEAFVSLQLTRGVTVRVLEDPVQLGKLVYCLTKAIAERPFKAARLESVFSFHVGAGVGAGCRLEESADGGSPAGIDELWRCQLQCFPLVTAEVARTIMRAYPSPGHLIRAYAGCASAEEAVKLVADLQVCKGTGPLSTARRLGPELGKRIYAFYSSRDPNQVL
ncbi:hypothetical protein BOX15_Mlig009863g3, partial [Macrostomum lignano]